jgi:hypothetical protein
MILHKAYKVFEVLEYRPVTQGSILTGGLPSMFCTTRYINSASFPLIEPPLVGVLRFEDAILLRYVSNAMPSRGC